MRVDLVERAQRGDEDAFGTLVDEDGGRLFAIAFRILRDVERAEDAVQQTHLIAWRDLPRLRDLERYGPWLHRLLVNACYEESRRWSRWRLRVHVQSGLTSTPFRSDPLGRVPLVRQRVERTCGSS
jgi:DNA-directed RNA polymerase specialized sigma24 family protein